MEAFTFATQILAQLPNLIAAGVQVKSFVEQANTALSNAETNGGKILTSDWDESNKILADLRTQLHS